MESMQHAPFGELLQLLRKHKKINQQQLADRLGVHRNTIGGWERGDRLPETKGIVIELANQLALNGQETHQLLEASLTALAPYWQVPYQRNPLFTGREPILDQLHEVLSQQETAILSQSYALSGLGGIGKTQTAIEYIYRHANEYAAVFWIGAETYERIASDFLAFAEVLSLPERQEQDQGKVMAAVQRWLRSHKGWLLIFDNVEDLELVKSVLPAARSGAVLLTTRLQALGVAAQTIDLEKMSMEEGAHFLLRRAKALVADDQLNPKEEAVAREIVSAMDGLPLALDQAGAYIEATHCSLLDYLHLFQNHPLDLLNERETHADHPASVAKTFALAFEQLQRRNPAATELLTVCAFLAPDAIPEELFIEGTSQLGPTFEQMAAHPLQFNAAIKDLLAYSLIHRNPVNKTLTIHRLVQAVLKGSIQEAQQQEWGRRIITTINQIFPTDRYNFKHWPQCERLLPHALAGTTFIRDSPKGIPLDIASLLTKIASYLTERGRYTEAEPLYQWSLQILEQTLGSVHTDVAFSLAPLAQLYGRQGKYLEAESLFQRALHIYEHAFDPNPERIASTIISLALLYSEQGKYLEAEPLYQRALHICERALGPDHPLLAYALNNLADQYKKQENYLEAEPLLQRTLRLQERVLGPEHPFVAFPLQNLADIYREQGKYTEAEILYQQAQHIWEQAYGPSHPDVAYALNGQANLYMKQKKYVEAEQLFRRAMFIREQALDQLRSPHIAETLHDLAILCKKQGKYTEAELLLLRALHIREQSIGSNHIVTADSLYNLAELYHLQGKLAEAEPLYQRALAIREQQLGTENTKTVDTRKRYTALLEDLSSRT